MTQGMVAGKVAIVTGAGRGIGRAIATLMAREGARVVICDIGASLDGQGADTGPAQAVDDIRRSGGEALASTLSIAAPESADEIVRQDPRPSAVSISWSTTQVSCATASSTA